MKETKEALLALLVLGKLVSDRLKDGAQLDDAVAIGTALLMDGEFKKTVQAGYIGMELIDDEFKDFNLAKALDLVQAIPELVAVLQKK